MVVANVLLDPEAQARAQDPTVIGPSASSMSRSSPRTRTRASWDPVRRACRARRSSVGRFSSPIPPGPPVSRRNGRSGIGADAIVLRLAPALTLAAFLAPIGAGILRTLLPAFGVLPALGRTVLSLEPWRALPLRPVSAR